MHTVLRRLRWFHITTIVLIFSKSLSQLCHIKLDLVLYMSMYKHSYLVFLKPGRTSKTWKIALFYLIKGKKGRRMNIKKYCLLVSRTKWVMYERPDQAEHKCESNFMWYRGEGDAVFKMRENNILSRKAFWFNSLYFYNFQGKNEVTKSQGKWEWRGISRSERMR